jgi:hypothetical protein
MKNKKLVEMIISFLVIVSLIGVMSSLLGFRLAKKNGAMVTEPDRLVGFLISTESLNLDIFSDDSNNYQYRLYATVNKVTHTNEETGTTNETNDYVFEGVDSVGFFIFKQDGYTRNAFDEGIFDTSLNINASDNGNESISIEGTIYALPGNNIIICINNVYQCADGRIYAVPGTSFSFPSEGGLSVTQEEMFSKSDDSTHQDSSFSGTLNIKPQYPAESITIFQMNSSNEVLFREEYLPGSLPEMLMPTKDVDYLIVETNYSEADGNIRTERSIISNSEESLLTIYYPENNKWAMAQLTVLEWTE